MHSLSYGIANLFLNVQHITLKYRHELSDVTATWHHLIQLYWVLLSLPEPLRPFSTGNICSIVVFGYVAFAFACVN